jgi:hypothetical protein
VCRVLLGLGWGCPVYCTVDLDWVGFGVWCINPVDHRLVRLKVDVDIKLRVNA